MRRTFTAEEQGMLARNPNVCSVNETQICYTNEFKQHFMKRYLEGAGPQQIFEEAGLPTRVLGYKRIERAAYHWRKAYEKGTLGLYAEHEAISTPQETMAQIIARQRNTIQYLERELERLKATAGQK
ncbi:MAG: hypothetical protein Q4C72_02040 [Eubacteriales bacterium]|nr:hypothetical protein [Eubacteriales bacterium]